MNEWQLRGELVELQYILGRVKELPLGRVFGACHKQDLSWCSIIVAAMTTTWLLH